MAEKQEPTKLSGDTLSRLTKFESAEVDFNQFINGLLLPSPYALEGFTFINQAEPTLLINDPALVGGPPLSVGIAVGRSVIVKVPAPPDAISFTGVQLSANAVANLDLYDSSGNHSDTAPFQMNGKLTTDAVVITGLARRYPIFGVRADSDTSWILSRIVTNIIS